MGDSAVKYGIIGILLTPYQSSLLKCNSIEFSSMYTIQCVAILLYAF